MDQVCIWCSKYYHTFLLLLILNIVKVESKRCSPDSYHPCKLYAAGFFPLTERIPQGEIGRGVMPAVDLALQSINSKPAVIEGYHLDLVRKDTECDPAVGMKAFFDMVDSEPKKLMLFGDACTSVTDPVAKASKFFHLLQLSYADTNPMYTAESYPNFYRVVPSEAAFNPARLALLQRFNWTKVGTIYESSPRYSMPHSKLLTDLDKVNIQFEFTQTISEDIQTELQKLKDKGVRIILGNFGEKWARRIFCQAYKHGIYGRKYQWIIAGEYKERWWETVDPTLECNVKELLQALDGYIATDVLPLSSSQEITASGMTAADYEHQYNKIRGNEYSKFHGYAYDGMWTIAFALKYVKAKLSSKKLNIRLEDFDYRKPFWSQIFKEALNQTFFTGVTGNVSFDGNERRGSILLKQFQNGREVKIGEYHSTTDELDLESGEKITWQGSNTPPVDRIIEEIVASRISLTLFVVISIFAVIGIILALVFLSMNIKYRKQRYIKMSSPYLNNIIIIGCILTYTSVILLGLDSRLLSEDNFPYICAARAWVLMSGFTLAFGSMFSKTWRVHAIFTNIKLNKKVIKDYQLFLIVAILICIDVATMTTWQIVDPFYRKTAFGTPEPSPENEDILIVPQMEYCHSRRMTLFLGSIYVYKGLLMAFGCFLAWETRHVSIPALNDSKYIGMSVYNVVIMCVIGAGLSFVLKEQQDAAFLIISIFIIFCSTATLCLVFVPKVRLLIEHKRYPNMDERRVRPTLKPLKKYREASEEMKLHARLKVLHEFNTRQRQRLKEKTYELEALMFRLRQYRIQMAANEDDISETEIITNNTIQSCGENKITYESRFLIFNKNNESSDLNRSEKKSTFATLSASITKLSSKENLDYNRNEKARRSCPELRKSDIENLMTIRKRRQTQCGLESYRIDEDEQSTDMQINISKSCSAYETRYYDVSDVSKSNFSPNLNALKEDNKYQSTANEVIYSIEYDDNSYNKAIKASIKQQQSFNGFSTSCEEDDSDNINNSSVNSQETNKQQNLYVNKRRSQSLSTLQFNLESVRNRSLGNNLANFKKFNHVRHGSMVKAYVPYFEGISNLNQDMVQNAPLFSSYPLIKCDIVEYL